MIDGLGSFGDHLSLERRAEAIRLSTEELILLLRSVPIDYYDKDWNIDGSEIVRIPYGRLMHLAASHLEKFVQTTELAKQTATHPATGGGDAQ